MTQHEKIIEMCKDGEWHCQIQFWNLFIRSPHKRRQEIVDTKDSPWLFHDRPCEHGVRNGRDYRMIQKAKQKFLDNFPPPFEISPVQEKKPTGQIL